MAERSSNTGVLIPPMDTEVDYNIHAPPNSPIEENTKLNQVAGSAPKENIKKEAKFVFPLYAPISADNDYEEKYDGAEFILCLYRQPTANASDFCGVSCTDFSELIEHLKNDHGLILRKNIEFCLSCSEIFENPLSALDHYLNKALNYEQFDFQWKTEQENFEIKRWLQPYFETMKALKKDILDFFLFLNEDLPGLEDEVFGDIHIDNPNCCH